MSPSSYTNTIFNQSACVLSLGLFCKVSCRYLNYFPAAMFVSHGGTLTWRLHLTLNPLWVFCCSHPVVGAYFVLERFSIKRGDVIPLRTFLKLLVIIVRDHKESMYFNPISKARTRFSSYSYFRSYYSPRRYQCIFFVLLPFERP